MEAKRTTIKDIANLAQVSPAAVSMAINGREGLSDATKNRILHTIKEMNYYPNAASQRLVHRKSFNIALFYPAEVSPFSNFFYNEVVHGLVEELTESRLNVVFVPLFVRNGQCKIPDIINKQDADGAIFLHDAPTSLLNKLDSLELPYMLFDWQKDPGQRTNIDLDNKHSIYMATKYLIDKGHKNIAFLGPSRYPQFFLRCFAGYQSALDEAKLPIYTGWIQDSVHDVESACAALKKLMDTQPQPTAVCCAHDECALHAIKAATILDIPVPEKLSFVGKDDISVSSYVYPELTTVSYDKNKIGKDAACLLLKMLGGETVENVVACMDGIIERKSVATLWPTERV